MTPDEISKLFKLESIDQYECASREEYLLRLSEQVDNFLLNNPSKIEILLGAFDFNYSIKLLENDENLEVLKNILRNNEILTHFKTNKFGTIELILIITAYNNSTEYFISKIENKNKIEDKNIEKIYEKYINFIDSTKDIHDFKTWYKDKIELLTANLFLALRARIIKNEDQMKICENITLKNSRLEELADFENVFSNYIQDIYYPMINQREFRNNERNRKENKFIRDLYNMFNSLTNNRISYKLISELVSSIFNKHMNESQIKKIIRDGNISTSITQYKIERIYDENYNIKEQKIIRDDEP